MKKVIYILTVPALFFISSCGETEEGGEGSGTEVDSTVVEADLDLSKYREYDMTDMELNAVIMIPKTYHKEEDEDGTPVDKFDQPEILHNDGEARWEIRMPGHDDRYWHMVIEDWGEDERNVAIEKEEHENQKGIFDFIYVEEGDGFIRYSKVLKTDNTTMTESAAKNMPNHHFYCVKMIQGSYVVFRSFEMGDFRELSIKQMLTGARGSFEK